MKIHKLDNLPSKEQYVQGFKDIKPPINDQQRCLLQKQYYSPNKIVTATQLAELAEIKGGFARVNIIYGRLGHLLSDAIGIEPSYKYWTMLSSGGYIDKNNPNKVLWQMYEEVAMALEELGWVNKKSNYDFNEVSFKLAEELADKDEIINLYEGSKQIITVNRYERNNQARKQCIQHYGTNCYVCGFNFEKAFGEIGKSFIHVHHLIPLSEINQEYEVNPIEDLRPVCPNCHTMIHQKNPPYTIEQIKNMVKYLNIFNQN
ncbi:MAG: HNH endonuclease [Dolichospermum sp. DET50]|nr:HNH endonuclease [Dolichospermum sp. DET66]MBS3031911.1 HNH endonuclease [Dolichospermum sp. DET67]MBS3037121.1 HNH endonuclease [Dolichospermum sp. DET50]